MTKMIQIRNVPDDIHRTLKVRAAERGMSLSDFLLAEIEEVAKRPSVEEMLERLRRMPKLDLTESAADAVRAERDSR